MNAPETAVAVFFLLFAIVLTGRGGSGGVGGGVEAALSSLPKGLKTFGHSVKNGPLPYGEEVTVFEHNCTTAPCAITQIHVPSIYPRGSDTWDWQNGRLFIYVDGETTTASVNVTLLELAWVGRRASVGRDKPSDARGLPWGVDLFGHTANSGGVYSTLRVPFGNSVRVTIRASPSYKHDAVFWCIVRGLEAYPVVLGDITLPASARLRVSRVEQRVLPHLGFVDLAAAPAGVSGALLGVKFDAHSAIKYGYLEACMRLYNGATTTTPTFLSSGAEDYFLSASYFDEGEFQTDNSGLTYYDGQGALSAYKLHDARDPVFFADGMTLRWRMGENTTGCGATLSCPNQFCRPGAAPREFAPSFKSGSPAPRHPLRPAKSALGQEVKQEQKLKQASSCTSSPAAKGYDRPGGDKYCFTLNSKNATPAACAQACCEASYCQAWVFAKSPGSYMDCKAEGDMCCWLKGQAMPQVQSNVTDITSGIVSGHPLPPAPSPAPGPVPAPPGTAVYSVLTYTYEWPTADVDQEGNQEDANTRANVLHRLPALRAVGLASAEEDTLVDAIMGEESKLSTFLKNLINSMAVGDETALLRHIRRRLALASVL